MPRRFKDARQLKKLKVIEAAEKLGISQPTLSAWEGERKSPTLDNLERMADLYGVTADYLLGRTDRIDLDATKPLPAELLPALDGKPIWSPKYGWLLVHASARQLVSGDGSLLSFSDCNALFIAPPRYAEPELPGEETLSKYEISNLSEVWLEPISPDRELRDELRGWYRVKERYVENEYGNRFYLDTYGAKWLALNKHK